MTQSPRKEIAGTVLACLRDVGPQTVEQIRGNTKLTKREVEDALWRLADGVEYEWPSTSPLVYKVAS